MEKNSQQDIYMSNVNNSHEKKESTFAYQKRISPLKEQIVSLGEKNMDNTIWVIRRWLKEEMGLINAPKKIR